jgi:hypothetical protein
MIKKSSGSAFRFRFFEAEEVDTSADVAGDDQPAIMGQCTTLQSAIAGERGE